MKTFAYLRVSGSSQIDGDGERRQHEAIRNFCTGFGRQCEAEFFDPAVKGTTEAIDRPQFARLLETAERGDCIVVERLDRLARDLMVQEFLLKECRERGIKVSAVDMGTWEDLASNDVDPTRVLIRQVLGALAQWEKSALVLKLHKARMEKISKGGYGGGEKPYGATPEEQKTLDAVKVLQASGTPLEEIVEILNLSNQRTRRGHYWTEQNLNAILNGLNRQAHRKAKAKST